MDFDHLTETVLNDGIHEILTNSSYKINAQKLSQLFQDRPMTPLKTAIFWIEYIIRYDGAKHMQSSAVYLNLIQYNSLDVILFLIIIFYILFKIIVKIGFFMIKYRPILILTIAIFAYLILSLGKSE